MARKKPGTSAAAEFVLFDVVYDDGAQLSNRRIPAALLSGFDGDEPAKEFFEAEDRKIAELSGRPRGAIVTIKRSATR